MTNSASTNDSSTDRTYDIVLFGATGFVGTLVGQYLTAHAPQSTRIALAGRNLSKLESTRRDLGGRAKNWDIIEADSFNPDQLADLAGSTTTVISTVGPYYRYGFTLVHECARAGTHYVDLSGEVAFMRRSIDENHELAQSTGARIVHACGFDSVPSDIGMWLLHETVQESGSDQLQDATMVVKMKGGVSGGTIDSMRQQYQLMQRDSSVKKMLNNPYSLSPNMESEPRLDNHVDTGTEKLDKFGIEGGLAGPFIMASCNTRVVRRSNALLDHAYGSQLRYAEHVYLGTGFKAKRSLVTMLIGLSVLNFTLSRPATRKFFSNWLPEPGEGPTEAQRENGFFSTTTYGTTTSGKTFESTVSLDADPGYKGTSLMLSEAALTLALEELDTPTGVLTPATALGDAYVSRLRDAGMKLHASQA